MSTFTDHFNRDVSVLTFCMFVGLGAFISFWAAVFIGIFDVLLYLIPLRIIGDVHPIFCAYAILFGSVMVRVMQSVPVRRMADGRWAFIGAGLGVFVGQFSLCVMTVGLMPALVAAGCAYAAYHLPLGVARINEMRTVRALSLAV